MDESTANKRPRDPEEWSVASSSSRRRTDPAASSRPSRSGTQTVKHPWFKVWAGGDFSDAYSAVYCIERNHKGVVFHAVPNHTGQFLVRPHTTEGLTILQGLVEKGKIGDRAISIEPLAEAQRPVKAVVMRFPLELKIELLTRLPFVTTPQRCKAKSGMPTRQVTVYIKGEIPESLDLGMWGCFPLRPWRPEPLRCYKCHRWGHHQRRCIFLARCGVCSGDHPSSVCILKHRQGLATVAKCPNCKGNHHAWNPRCKSRKYQVQRQRKHPRPEQNRSTKPAKPAKEKPPPAPRQRPAPRKRIQLASRAVSRSTAAVERPPFESLPEPSMSLIQYLEKGVTTLPAKPAEQKLHLQALVEGSLRLLASHQPQEEASYPDPQFNLRDPRVMARWRELIGEDISAGACAMPSH